MKKLRIKPEWIKPINVFNDRPIILASKGIVVHATFEVKLFGRRVFISVEDIPDNYPSTLLWIFEDEEKLVEIFKGLEYGGWEIQAQDNLLKKFVKK
ncbi:MAG: hypothetical protein QXH91_04140 [Candidatus Bathyarchaeia archaeon]